MKPPSLDGLDQEMRDHIERETRDNFDRGMNPDDARRAARRAFGNVTSAREDVRASGFPSGSTTRSRTSATRCTVSRAIRFSA
jgi:hypothetical protein